MKAKNSSDVYNRLSFRSPLRKTNHIKHVTPIIIKTNIMPAKDPVNVSIDGLTAPVKDVVKDVNDGLTAPVKDANDIKPTEIQPIMVKSNVGKIHNRISCRSPSVKRDNGNDIYHIVTKTPSGEQVQVPTNQCSFIKYKDTSVKIAAPIKQVHVNELIIIKKKKYHFEEALNIYENNQTYYLSKIMYENDELIVNEIIKDIDVLEKWFCHINEPKPKCSSDLKDWKARNEFKKEYGYSKFFNIELLHYTDYK